MSITWSTDPRACPRCTGQMLPAYGSSSPSPGWQRLACDNCGHVALVPAEQIDLGPQDAQRVARDLADPPEPAGPLRRLMAGRLGD